MPGGAHENMRGWSPEEDEMLLQLITTSGKRWKLIAEALCSHAGATATPRTPAMVRNRFLRIERGKWLTEQGLSKNRCGQCGQLKRGHVCQAPRALVNTSFQAQEARHEAARLRLGGEYGSEPMTVASPRAVVVGADDRGPNPVAHALSLGSTAAGAPSSASASSSSSGLPSVMPSAIPEHMRAEAGPSAGPPMLRTQDSMEILVMASEMQSLAPDADGGNGDGSGGEPTPTMPMDASAPLMPMDASASIVPMDASASLDPSTLLPAPPPILGHQNSMPFTVGVAAEPSPGLALMAPSVNRMDSLTSLCREVDAQDEAAKQQQQQQQQQREQEAEEAAAAATEQGQQQPAPAPAPPEPLEVPAAEATPLADASGALGSDAPSSGGSSKHGDASSLDGISATSSVVSVEA